MKAGVVGVKWLLSSFWVQVCDFEREELRARRSFTKFVGWFVYYFDNPCLEGSSTPYWSLLGLSACYLVQKRRIAGESAANSTSMYLS